ncbi:hypothetical protein Tco_0859184 [Tanacetum coccineum]|uniref:Reverse transcriptase domain-containing protein n=1 Tax=Tanacetum coccineum TaxID=301880 RepID=A0ABQ5BE94_9ASTR
MEVLWTTSRLGNSFQNSLSRLDHMLKSCEDTNLSLNWEKSHFMVKEGIVLGHKISKKGIEVDKAKIDVNAITSSHHRQRISSFLVMPVFTAFHSEFSQKYPETNDPSPWKEYSIHLSEDCIRAFQIIKRKTYETPILISPKLGPSI